MLPARVYSKHSCLVGPSGRRDVHSVKTSTSWRGSRAREGLWAALGVQRAVTPTSAPGERHTVSWLTEICVKGSADDQSPHFAGPSPDLI